jgi:hypothetical protein
MSEQSMMGLRYRWIISVVLCATATAQAHHSAAMFDLKQTETIKGSVKVYQWTNPHGFIYVDVADKEGNVAEYSIELTSPNLLARRGWRPASLKVGDPVTVVFNPFRDGTKGGRVVSVKTPDGKVLTERDAP